MVAEGTMNNRSSRSATGQRAPETFVVDLTSVCLRSGTVRLPLSMNGRFNEGQHKVTAGGEELVIEFEAPRTLLGLGPFFVRAELKANDRVQFVFNSHALELTALKRERPRSARSTAPALQAGTSFAEGRTEIPKAQGNNGSRLTSRGLFPAPAELADVSTGPAPSATPGDAPADDTAPAAAESWHETGANGVRRVRIEGGLPPRTDTAPPRPVDLASARDVWARRQQAPWRSLDTMVAGPVVAPEEAAEAFSQSTIRVVRRSKGTSTPLEVEAPPLPRPEPDAPVGPRPQVSYSVSWPLPETSRGKAPTRRADGAASERVATTQPHARADAVAPVSAVAHAELDPYLDAPIDAAREAHYTPPTILESDLLEVPSGGKWRTESEAAYLKYQEGQVAFAADPVAVPAERRQGLLGRLGLGLGRGSRGSAGSSEGSSGQSSRRAPAEPTRPTPVPEEPAELAAEPPLPEFAVRIQEAADTRIIVDESVYDVDFDTEVQPHLLVADDGVHSLESDMAQLRQYLGQPNVPAIVRCDDLAVRLSMSLERVSNAMLRLSEDRDLYTPLRGDAYMVRRAR
jgi:hypothetical protein